MGSKVSGKSAIFSLLIWTTFRFVLTHPPTRNPNIHDKKYVHFCLSLFLAKPTHPPKPVWIIGRSLRGEIATEKKWEMKLFARVPIRWLMIHPSHEIEGFNLPFISNSFVYRRLKTIPWSCRTVDFLPSQMRSKEIHHSTLVHNQASLSYSILVYQSLINTLNISQTSFQFKHFVNIRRCNILLEECNIFTLLSHSGNLI